MTKIEKQKTQQFISSIVNKDYSKANNALECVVAEKLKARVRTTVQENKK